MRTESGSSVAPNMSFRRLTFGSDSSPSRALEVLVFFARLFLHRRLLSHARRNLNFERSRRSARQCLLQRFLPRRVRYVSALLSSPSRTTCLPGRAARSCWPAVAVTPRRLSFGTSSDQSGSSHCRRWSAPARAAGLRALGFAALRRGRLCCGWSAAGCRRSRSAPVRLK